MVDLAPLLAGIIADPDNDALRLIYADACEENGDEARADFIRVQVRFYAATVEALAYPVGGMPISLSDEIVTLRRRERELLSGDRWSMWCEWIPNPWLMAQDFAPDFDISDQRDHLRDNFRRGFIESIRCTWDAWLQHADAIRAATPLREVDLTTPPERAWLVDKPYPFLAAAMAAEWPGIKFTEPNWALFLPGEGERLYAAIAGTSG